MSEIDFSKFAYSIGELANKGPIRRSNIYNQIASGRLRARKIGRRTIILDEDWQAFLASTPVMTSAKGAAAASSTTAPQRRRGKPHRIPVNAVTEPVDALTASTATTEEIPARRSQGETGAGS
jgi:hypothetical protein